MKNMPLVSIIVPVYNVKEHIDRCVQSIIKQTYRNLEILLIDDGSTDESPAICDQYAKKDKRITVVHKKNGGLSSARNTGLKKVKARISLSSIPTITLTKNASQY